MTGRKKNEQIKRMVAQIESLKSEYRVPAATLVCMARVSLPSYMRWKRRIKTGGDPLLKPGAQKIDPIDLKALKRRIGKLPHARKRTAGTGNVYAACRHGISRREFNAMVKEVRADTNKDKTAGQSRVVWLRSDLAWAMDGLEYRDCHVQNVQDLCSRYKFAPLTSAHEPVGEEIAGHLSRHFARFGPPLFLKRDNAGNLNHCAVNDLLEAHRVIPINSPYYTPSYNGAIEHSQGELKTWLVKWKHVVGSGRELELQVDNAAHALNHRPGAVCPAKMLAGPIFHHRDCGVPNVSERKPMTGSSIWPLTYPCEPVRMKSIRPRGAYPPENGWNGKG